MAFDELKIFGTGTYDVGITVEPMPHLRGSRYNDDGYSEGVTLLARVKGGELMGAARQNSFEVNMFAPMGVEDVDGDRIILASFEFHSLTLNTAHNGVLRFTGYLSGAEAHPQEVYDSIMSLTSPAELEKIPALTTVTGLLKYMPPVWEDAQQFIGWQAELTMRPYKPAK